MKLTKLKSSNISGYHYDRETKALTIGFHSGTRYVYHDVPQGIVDGLSKADSAGSYFYKHVRGFSNSKAKKEE